MIAPRCSPRSASTGPREPLWPVCSALAAALLLAACGTDEDVADDDPEPTTAVAAVELEPRDLSRELRATARVEPFATIRLASRTDGTVHAVHAEAGDRVETGDVLVELDVAEERAELRRAEARAEEARLEYERTARLRAREVASAAQYERARAALRSAESEQELWQTRVDYGTVRATRDGLITDRWVEPGEAVEEREGLLELATIDRLVVRPGISERDVIHLRPGRTLPLHVDALPDTEFEGRIRRVMPVAASGSQQVRVEIALPDSAAEDGVRPGNLVRIRGAIDERADVLAVPAAAIGGGDEGNGERYVYVIDDGRLERRVIERGVTRGPWTEVVDGLEAGEIVLASNPIDFSDGERVRIVGWRG